jgi:hypothetical protein
MVAILAIPHVAKKVERFFEYIGTVGAITSGAAFAIAFPVGMFRGFKRDEKAGEQRYMGECERDNGS